MNISYNWLNEILDSRLSVDEVAKHLTRVGFAVEGVHPHGDDFVLDIDLTSNRPDCLSHRGIARELATVLGKPLVQEDISFDSVAGGDLVTIEDSDLCNRFTARIIRGVKVAPSPKWLAERLEAIGERSINNVADITNYVMHELGQPMHAFDLDMLAGGRIVVRRARPGETIRTLDDVERDLAPSMLAICDSEKPAAIAGIMGGSGSSITDTTINVLLEVAYFNRANIRATSRMLHLSTEASYRFERGTDVLNLIRASERAADLICELAGGEKGEFVDVFPVPYVGLSTTSEDIAAAVKRLTGLTVGTDRCVSILNDLGIRSETRSNNVSTFFAPSWRHDVAIEEDLVEEIARHVGYENIAEELPPAFGAGEYQPFEHRERSLRSCLADLGYVEALSYSFIDQRHDGVFEVVPGIIDSGAETPYITLQDSVIEGALRMRPTILPGLLDAVRLNLNHQQRDIRLFEIGKVFATERSEDGLPNEQKLLAIAITGGELHAGRAKSIRNLDFFDIKGAVEASLASIGFSNATFGSMEVKHLRKGQGAVISLNRTEIGFLGRLDDEIASNYKFKQPVFVAEISLSRAMALEPESRVYRPLPRYPSVIRDVSFIIDRSITFADLRETILEQGVELCRGVVFVDEFKGDSLAPGERSLTIRLEYRSDERTLIEDEVEAVHTSLLDAIEQNLGVRPQGA